MKINKLRRRPVRTITFGGYVRVLFVYTEYTRDNDVPAPGCRKIKKKATAKVITTIYTRARIPTTL